MVRREPDQQLRNRRRHRELRALLGGERRREGQAHDGLLAPRLPPRGRDGSGTGLGMEWDFIIIHESAHEWFGNNITSKDNADMWVHESFANYAEGIYTECLHGKDAGARYVLSLIH